MGIVLPTDLKIETADVQVFNYLRQENIQKSKITLSKNTISFLRKGVKEVIGEDEIVKIHPNEFVLMKSGKCLMTEKVSSEDQLYHSVLLFFSNDQVLEFVKKYEFNNDANMDSKSFYTFEYDHFLEHFVEGLEKITRLEGVHREKILQAKFEELMHYLIAKNGASFLFDLFQKIDHQAQRIHRVVQNNLYNKLTVSELAFLSHMSASTFKREFFKIYQMSPIKFFQNKRLDHAADLLKSYAKKPSEIYEDAGYENFSNFIQAFKKKFGMTPKQYQNQ